MGRPRGYDADDLVNQAMKLFWRQGYSGTSTADLVEKLGVNKFSIYAEFGSKQALYEAALKRYDSDIVTSHFGRLERPEAGLAEILTVVDFFAQSGRRPGADMGCFMCNSATERGANDPATHQFVEGFFSRIRAACVMALQNARARGEVGMGFDVEEEASWIMATLLGLFVLMRAQADPSFLIETGRAASHHLNRLRRSTSHP